MLSTSKEVLERFNATFKKPEPKMFSDPSCIVILRGLPKPDADKRKKLLRYIYEHIVKETGEVEKTEHIHIPLDQNGVCSGVCFIRFTSSSDAKKCVAKFHTNNTIFGEDYQLSVCQYSYIDELQKLPKTYHPQPYVALDCSEHHKRLYFPVSGRINHEFLLLTKANINRCMFNGEGINVTNTEPCSEKLLNVSYSPMGTYFILHYEESIVLHKDNGTSITISKDLDSTEIRTFIRAFKISPCERFLITFSYTANVDELEEYDLSGFLKNVETTENESELYRAFEQGKHITASIWSLTERRVLSTLGNTKLYSYINVNDAFVKPEDRVEFSSTGNLVVLLNKENMIVYRIEFSEDGIYSVSLQETLLYPNITTFIFSPNRYGQDLLAIYQKSTNEQKPSIYSILNLNAPRNTRSGGRVIATNSFYITGGRFFWSANGGCLAIITESQVNGNLLTTIFVVIIQGNSEDVSYDKLKEAIINNMSTQNKHQTLTVKLEQLELPQNLFIQSACWSYNGSTLAFITIPVGSSKEVQEESRKCIRMQKQSNANSLQFSLKALDAFMKHAVDERELLLNDGQAAIYLFTLQEKYGLYPCKIGPPVFSHMTSGGTVSCNKDRSATIKIRKIPGITASEVMFSPYNDYLAALNRNDRKELALTLIDTTTLEKTSAEIEVIDGCSWDSSGRYLIAYKYGGKSSSFGLYIINVTGMVTYSTTLASLVENLLSAVWRPYDRALLACCTKKTPAEIKEYCEANYESLLSARADDSLMQEQIKRNQDNWLSIFNAERLEADDVRLINKRTRDCFVLHKLDGNLSGFDENGSALSKDIWMKTIQETIDVLEEELAEHTISLEDYEKLYNVKDTEKMAPAAEE